MTPGAAPGREAVPGPAAAPTEGSRVPTLVLGSGGFAVPILEAVLAHPRTSVVGVVTAPDRPAGRSAVPAPTPVATAARAAGVPVLQPPRLRSADAVAAVAALQPALGVLADYGQIVPGAILGLPDHGILNVHPSLLPRHRGATPIPATIAAGDTEAGVTVIRMDEGIDTGPIVASRSWALGGSERAPELEARAAAEGAVLLAAVLDDWIDGRLEARPQAAGGASVTRLHRREDGRLDPSLPAVALERHVRAMVPWPGSFVDTALGRVVVLDASTAATEPGDEPGRFVDHDGLLALATAEGRLVIDRAQRSGRRPSDGRAFRRGQGGLVGTSALPAGALNAGAAR